MKTKTMALVIFFISTSLSYSQDVHKLKYGEPVNLDGIITNGEWDDADFVEVAAPTSQPIKIYFKHDGTNFLAAFVLSNIATNEYKIPEVMFDTHNDKSEVWLPDDWWFHVSAQDCEAQGEHDVWDDCSIVQPDWWAVPNFGVGYAPPIDTIELIIPWSKLNLQSGDTIGFAFNFWISDDLRLYWPEEATIESPDSWTTVVISEDLPWQYLGQVPPGLTPERFPPDYLLANENWFWHGPPVFSPSGKSLFMSRYYSENGDVLIYGMEVLNGEWTIPEIPVFCDNFNANSPALNTNGDSLFFVSWQPSPGYFYTTKPGNFWSDAVEIDIPIPAQSFIGNSITVARNRTLYFELSSLGNDDLYKSSYINDQYLNPIELGSSINTVDLEFSPFIDPDEEFIIFSSIRNEGYGASDLYISVKDVSGVWQPAQNLGDAINTKNDDFGPTISNDGNYLFFCSLRDDDEGYNPYWVDIQILDPFLTSLAEKKTGDYSIHIYPNPFSDKTTIEFELNINVFISIKIYDSFGKKIETILNEYQSPGKKKIYWDGKTISGRTLNPGIYYFIFQLEQSTISKKILFLD